MPLEGVPKKRFFALSILEDTSHHKSFDAGISLEHWKEQKKIVTEKMPMVMMLWPKNEN